MRADIRLSTNFVTTQNAHQIGLLASIEGETPIREQTFLRYAAAGLPGQDLAPPAAAARADQGRQLAAGGGERRGTT